MPRQAVDILLPDNRIQRESFNYFGPTVYWSDLGKFLKDHDFPDGTYFIMENIPVFPAPQLANIIYQKRDAQLHIFGDVDYVEQE